MKCIPGSTSAMLYVLVTYPVICGELLYLRRICFSIVSSRRCVVSKRTKQSFLSQKESVCIIRRSLQYHASVNDDKTDNTIHTEFSIPVQVFSTSFQYKFTPAYFPASFFNKFCHYVLQLPVRLYWSCLWFSVLPLEYWAAAISRC